MNTSMPVLSDEHYRKYSARHLRLFQSSTEGRTPFEVLQHIPNIFFWREEEETGKAFHRLSLLSTELGKKVRGSLVKGTPAYGLDRISPLMVASISSVLRQEPFDNISILCLPGGFPEEKRHVRTILHLREGCFVQDIPIEVQRNADGFVLSASFGHPLPQEWHPGAKFFSFLGIPPDGLKDGPPIPLPLRGDPHVEE